MVNVAPQLIQTKKYLLKIRTHVISDFKKERIFKNNLKNPKHRIYIPDFTIDRNGNCLAGQQPGDPTITISEVVGLCTKVIKECADSSYNLNPRDVVLLELVLESHDGDRVTRVGMCSTPDNVPLFNNTNTFSRH